MHDMTFSTQRKLRLKLRINHCILMSLHRASSCLALSCLLSFSDMQSPHVRKRNIIKGGLHIILLICFLSEGCPRGGPWKRNLSFDEKLVKQEEVWNFESRTERRSSNYTMVEVIQQLNCSMCMVIKKNIRKMYW